VGKEGKYASFPSQRLIKEKRFGEGGEGRKKRALSQSESGALFPGNESSVGDEHRGRATEGKNIPERKRLRPLAGGPS